MKLQEIDRGIEIALRDVVVADGYWPNPKDYIGNEAGFDTAKTAIKTGGKEVVSVFGVGNAKNRGTLTENRITIDRMTPVPNDTASTNAYEYEAYSETGGTGRDIVFIDQLVKSFQVSDPDNTLGPLIIIGSTVTVTGTLSNDGNYTVVGKDWDDYKAAILVSENIPDPEEVSGQIFFEQVTKYNRYLLPNSRYDIEYAVHMVCASAQYDRILDDFIRRALGGQRKRVPAIDENADPLAVFLITFSGAADLSDGDYIERVIRYTAKDIDLEGRVLVDTGISQITEVCADIGVTLHPEGVNLNTGELGIELGNDEIGDGL